ncbi:MAG: hypothetical protein WBB73_15315 [Candidatus Aminicenantaceae bacterium]
MWEIILEIAVELIPLSFLKRFRKGKEWTGVVEEIKTEGGLIPAKRNVIVVFRKQNGSTTRLKMRSDESLAYAIGQRYRKHSGESLPRPI